MGSWWRQANLSVRLRPLAAALVLLGGACSSAPEPIDPRTPAALAAPTPADWRAAAAGIAAEVAAALKDQSDHPPVALRPAEGAAPVDLNDMLLAELVLAGVPVAAEDKSRLSLHCRVSASGVTEPPRGIVTASLDPTAETVLLCLLADRGRYVAAARRILRPDAAKQREGEPRGIIVEITG